MPIVVARYFDPLEARIVCARLQAEDIPAFLAGDQHSLADRPISIALGGSRVLVPTSFATRATEVVAAYADGSLARDLEQVEPETGPCCPTCDRQGVSSSPTLASRLFVVLLFLWTLVPVPPPASRLACRNCGRNDLPIT
ncbi:hypothetical protein CSC70_01605 [Pseudoxanthomonas kalamensis DSM 18571]|uniref:DUF2007 domain-containing protein n=1 Tax=Pseudoxanthomonas kalamensis TaxID=289483 RepID=UPI001390D1AF|nr:DUF2007 domain-containing protein [Pseudoxanthomonas kalamensis]KAF1712250.1 hypothetical protein CSC70_01605 [Pseudoxanthomonas kalamensis DSM 18571]